MKRIQMVLAIALVAAGCGAAGRGMPDGGGHGLGDGHIDPGPQQGCDTGASGCYTVYAHSDHHLYLIDLMAKSLVDVGPFNAPQVTGPNGKTAEDVITDLGVATDGTIYVVSKTSLYTASATNGQVTKVAGISACGIDVIALSFMPDGSLYTADYMGAFCKITGWPSRAISSPSVTGRCMAPRRASPTPRPRPIISWSRSIRRMRRFKRSAKPDFQNCSAWRSRSGRCSASRTTARATSSPSIRRPARARCSTRSPIPRREKASRSPARA
jgi:hypothetical protein